MAENIAAAHRAIAILLFFRLGFKGRTFKIFRVKGGSAIPPTLGHI